MNTPSGTGATFLASAFQIAPDGSFMFPRLRGLTLEYTPRPTFSTIVQTAADRSTTRIQLDPYPLWEYDLTFGFVADEHRYSFSKGLTNPAGKTDYEQILGLFLACGGQRDSFLIDLAQITLNPRDSKVSGVQIGTGDGANTQFQLVRPFGGFLDLVDNPISASIQVTVTPAPVTNIYNPANAFANGGYTSAADGGFPGFAGQSVPGITTSRFLYCGGFNSLVTNIPVCGGSSLSDTEDGICFYNADNSFHSSIPPVAASTPFAVPPGVPFVQFGYDSSTIANDAVMVVSGSLPASYLPFGQTQPGGASSAGSIVSVANGVVTLAAAPAVGAGVRASFSFLHRMRFTKDEDEYQAMWKNLYSRDKLTLRQERNETA